MSELDDLRETVREFLGGTSSSEAVRSVMATDAGADEKVWAQLTGELGLAGIAVPEDFGGAGAGAAELAVVFEEAGAALLCAPLLATVAMAIPAILTSGDTAAAEELVPALVDGSATATLVLNGELSGWNPGAVTLRARRGVGEYAISGGASLTLDGHSADLILVAARTDAGISLFAVDAGADGLHRELLAGLDRTRRYARVRFDDVPARLIGSDGAAAEGLARTADLAAVMLAAEQLGGAQRCLDTAVAYAKERIQFGRAIGSFQAIKHRCADMLVQVEGARSAVVHAAAVADTDELPIAAAVAKLTASEAFLHAALDNMKVHGGIGFTWEHDAHLYVRRAKSTALMWGEPDHLAERLADLVTASAL